MANQITGLNEGKGDVQKATGVLPSGYKDEHDNVHRDVIVIPLCGWDEELLADRREWERDVLVTTLLSRCVRHIGGISPVTEDVTRRLLIVDRHYLLLMLREITLGEHVQASIACPMPDCGKRVAVRFSINDVRTAMGAIAPEIELTMDLRCHECGGEFEAPFDVQDFFLSEFEGGLELLYREVHYLAYHYHWGEREIMGMTREKRRNYIGILANEMDRLSGVMSDSMDNSINDMWWFESVKSTVPMKADAPRVRSQSESGGPTPAAPPPSKANRREPGPLPHEMLVTQDTQAVTPATTLMPTPVWASASESGLSHQPIVPSSTSPATQNAVSHNRFGEDTVTQRTSVQPGGGRVSDHSLAAIELPSTTRTSPGELVIPDVSASMKTRNRPAQTTNAPARQPAIPVVQPTASTLDLKAHPVPLPPPAPPRVQRQDMQRLGSHTPESAAQLVAHARQAAQEFAARMHAFPTPSPAMPQVGTLAANSVGNAPVHHVTADHPERQGQSRRVAQESRPTTQAPRAFWERSHLRWFQLRTLR